MGQLEQPIPLRITNAVAWEREQGYTLLDLTADDVEDPSGDCLLLVSELWENPYDAFNWCGTAFWRGEEVPVLSFSIYFRGKTIQSTMAGPPGSDPKDLQRVVSDMEREMYENQ